MALFASYLYCRLKKPLKREPNYSLINYSPLHVTSNSKPLKKRFFQYKPPNRLCFPGILANNFALIVTRNNCDTFKTLETSPYPHNLLNLPIIKEIYLFPLITLSHVFCAKPDKVGKQPNIVGRISTKYPFPPFQIFQIFLP